eukprot:6179982-Pleurochrysis_carterae.AAC.6
MRSALLNRRQHSPGHRLSSAREVNIDGCTRCAGTNQTVATTDNLDLQTAQRELEPSSPSTRALNTPEAAARSSRSRARVRSRLSSLRHSQHALREGLQAGPSHQGHRRRPRCQART